MANATLTPAATETQPSNTAVLKTIEKQFLTLAQKANLLWQQMAKLMIQVEAEELWRGEAKSFTAWVKAMAEQSGVQESTLWRYLKAGRTYNALRESPDPELAALPALGDAPCKAAPESLELLDKIRQAAPDQEAAELAKSTLAGESGRAELREAWDDYKAAMPVGPNEPVEAQVPIAGAILQALRKSRGAFCAGEPCHQWTLHANVDVDGQPYSAVGVALATAEQARPALHGVQLSSEASALPVAASWAAATDYVDAMWLAVPAALRGLALREAPAWVGVLVYDADGLPPERLQAVRAAHPPERQADRRGEMALELLKRLR